MPEIADTFSRVVGRQVDYFQSPWDQFEEQMGEENTVMYRWFNDYGYEADIAALREEHGLSSSSISTSVPTAGRTLRLHRKADERTVAWSCA